MNEVEEYDFEIRGIEELKNIKPNRFKEEGDKELDQLLSKVTPKSIMDAVLDCNAYTAYTYFIENWNHYRGIMYMTLWITFLDDGFDKGVEQADFWIGSLKSRISSGNRMIDMFFNRYMEIIKQEFNENFIERNLNAWIVWLEQYKTGEAEKFKQGETLNN